MILLVGVDKHICLLSETYFQSLKSQVIAFVCSVNSFSEAPVPAVVSSFFQLS